MKLIGKKATVRFFGYTNDKKGVKISSFKSNKRL